MVTFTITEKKSDRSIDGYTYYKATSDDGVEVSAKVANRTKTTVDTLKAELLKDYSLKLSLNKKEPGIKIGDTI